MYSSKEASRGTDVLSFRLPSERVDLLKKEAKAKKISLNVLANHIFDAYFDFGLSAKNSGFIFMPKKTLREIVNTLSEEEMMKLAKGPMKSNFIDLVYMLKGKLTLQSFLNTFLAWARDSSFPYRDDFDDGSRTITLNHDMGKKWSMLLREALTQCFQDIASRATFETREDVIVIKIRGEEES